MSEVLNPKQWVNKYADYLYSYAQVRLDDEELARDLVQETFLAALEKSGQFKGDSSEKTWLTAILKYKVIDVYRKRNSGLRNDPDESTLSPTELDFFETGDGHWKEEYAPQPFIAENNDPLMRKELSAILQKCLQRLPALWFSIFSMKHIDESDTSTICEELKITSSNFWVIIHRAKLNLRACVQKSGI